jgi:hypothetical protein
VRDSPGHSWTPSRHIFNSLRHATLFALTQPNASEPEPVLDAILESVDRVIQRAFEAACTVKACENVLYLLGKTDIELEDAQSLRAFQPFVTVSTMGKYKAVVKRIVRVIFRMELLPNDQRPNYILTPTLTDAMQELCTENATAADLDQQSTKLLLGLFQQIPKSSIYESVLVSALAVCGIREDGGFAAPSQYTPIYAALLKSSYWLILSLSMEEDQQADSPGLYKLVKAKLAQFLQPTSCPLFWVCRMLAYGRKVASDTAPESQVTWLVDTIQYQKMSFDMVQLSSIIASLIHQARSDLAKLVQSATLDGLPPIPWDRIVDNHSEQKVGYSFASEGDNDWLTPMNSLVYNKISSDAALLDKWLITRDDATLQFEQREVSRYKLQIDEFREKSMETHSTMVALLAHHPRHPMASARQNTAQTHESAICMI